jgi:hypothetical protein
MLELQVVLRRCVTVGLLSGCSSLMGPTMSDVVRARAVTDLDCPKDRISIYPDAGDLVGARGCGASTRYVCSYKNGDPICRAELFDAVRYDR